MHTLCLILMAYLSSQLVYSSYGGNVFSIYVLYDVSLWHLCQLVYSPPGGNVLIHGWSFSMMLIYTPSGSNVLTCAFTIVDPSGICFQSAHLYTLWWQCINSYTLTNLYGICISQANLFSLYERW